MAKLLELAVAVAAGASGSLLVNFVTLQASTPGTKETGHINVSGNVIAGKLLAGVSSSTSAITGFSSAPGSTGFQGTGRVFGSRSYSTSPSDQGVGAYGEAISPDGIGVSGKNKSTLGAGSGGKFESLSPSGTGVLGTSPFYGVVGKSTGTIGLGAGVWGDAPSLRNGAGQSGVLGTAVSGTGAVGYGVRGIVSTNETTNIPMIGVYGESDPTSFGFAVYGNGTMSASNKMFVVDDPTSPANRLLYHHCAEGADPLLIYSGTAKLSPSGEATVSLPEYFLAIAKDPRFALTAIGRSMPGLFVVPPAKGSKIFKISGGSSNGQVSWTTIATRNDPWIVRAGAPVQVEKPMFLRGKYIHPELYGHDRSDKMFGHTELPVDSK